MVLRPRLRRANNDGEYATRADEMCEPRARRGVTLEDLAEKLGWTRDAVSNIENGRRHVRVSNLIRIAKAFGMEPEALLERIVRW
jgi:transcriptional regulator with XRE-family HTH domain